MDYKVYEEFKDLGLQILKSLGGSWGGQKKTKPKEKQTHIKQQQPKHFLFLSRFASPWLMILVMHLSEAVVLHRQVESPQNPNPHLSSLQNQC